MKGEELADKKMGKGKLLMAYKKEKEKGNTQVYPKLLVSYNLFYNWFCERAPWSKSWVLIAYPSVRDGPI